MTITVSAPVNQPPVANFTYTPPLPTTQDTISFTDTSSDSDGIIISWLWSFGDGDSSAQQDPSHQYAEDGIYQINLTVWDDDGAVSYTHLTLPTN